MAPLQYLSKESVKTCNLLVGNGEVTEHVNVVVNGNVEPVEASFIDNVLKVVEQSFNSVLVVPDRVEAVGLSDLGNGLRDSVNTILLHHA